MPNTLGDTKIAGDLQVGNSSSPAVISAGSGAMSTTNKPDGSLHLRSDDIPEVKNNGSAEPIGLGQHCVECRMDDLVENSANTYKTYAPRKGKITGVSRRFLVKPASAAGTVVTGITIGGNQILNSGSEDEESISDDTLTAHALTATTANLSFSKGDAIIITVTSDNADMTGGTEPRFYLYYEDK